MGFIGGLAHDERENLYELINTLLERLDTQRRLAEDLTRKLDAANERLSLIDASHYGCF